MKYTCQTNSIIIIPSLRQDTPISNVVFAPGEVTAEQSQRMSGDSVKFQLPTQNPRILSKVSGKSNALVRSEQMPTETMPSSNSS